MNTELIILNTGSAYYNNVDLYEDVDISLTLQINDVRDPGKVKGTYSNSFKVPGTKNNNELFQHLFDINSDNTFDPRKKVNAEIRVNTIPIFQDGYIQLTNIIKNKSAVEYELILYGINTSIFNEVKNKKIDELDVSELNHNLLETTVSASWAGFGTTHNYTYPLIDYGQGESSNFKRRLRYQFGSDLCCTGFEAGYYINGAYNNDTDQYKGYWCEDMFPAISVKYLIDKIFADYGYTYSSSFLNSDIFKSLIIPFTHDETKLYDWVEVYNGELNTAMPFYYDPYYRYDVTTYEPWTMSQIGPTITTANTWNYYVYATYGYKWNRLIWNIENKDFYNCGDISRYTTVASAAHDGTWYPTNMHKAAPCAYQIMEPGNYVIKAEVTISDGTVPLFDREFCVAPYYLRNWSRTNNSSINNHPGYHSAIYISEGSATSDIPMMISASNTTITNNKLIAVSSNGTYNFTSSINNLKGGELIYLKPGYRDATGAAFGNKNYQLSISIEKEGYITSSSIDMNKVLPENVKITDFLSSLTKHFNLYWDKVGDKHYVIEPRDTYIDAGEVKDWTYKVDVGSEINIRTLNEEIANDYLWTINKDKDLHLSKQFELKYDSENSYGTYTSSLDIDFTAEDETKIESIFSEAPLSQWCTFEAPENFTTIYKPLDITGLGTAYIYAGNDWQTTHLYLGDGYNRIWPEVSDVEYVGNYRSTKHGLKLLFYKAKDVQANKIVATAPYVQMHTFKYDGNSYSRYPYAGHIYYTDNSGSVQQSTNLDLNFNTKNWFYGVPKTINNTVFETTPYTNRNCFNVYWSRWYEEITDKNSRIVEISVKLDPQDISDFKFNDVVFIDGTYYQVQSIEYKPKLDELAKLKLLKLQFHNINYTDTIDSSLFYTDDTGTGIDNGGAIFARVNGTNNTIQTGSSYIDIFGETNKVSDTSTYVQTFGANNTIISSSNINIQNSTGSYIYNSEFINVQNGNKNFVYGRNININGTNNLVIGYDIDINGNNNFISDKIYEVYDILDSASGNYFEFETNNTGSFNSGSIVALNSIPIQLFTVSHSIYDTRSTTTKVYPVENIPIDYYWADSYMVNITKCHPLTGTTYQNTIYGDDITLTGYWNSLHIDKGMTTNYNSPSGNDTDSMIYPMNGNRNVYNMISLYTGSNSLIIGNNYDAATKQPTGKTSIGFNGSSPINQEEFSWQTKDHPLSLYGSGKWGIIPVKNYLTASVGAYLYPGDVTIPEHINLSLTSYTQTYAIEFDAIFATKSLSNTGSCTFNGGYLNITGISGSNWLYLDDEGNKAKSVEIYPATLGSSDFVNGIKLLFDVSEYPYLKIFASSSLPGPVAGYCTIKFHRGI